MEAGFGEGCWDGGGEAEGSDEVSRSDPNCVTCPECLPISTEMAEEIRASYRCLVPVLAIARRHGITAERVRLVVSP